MQRLATATASLKSIDRSLPMIAVSIISGPGDGKASTLCEMPSYLDFGHFWRKSLKALNFNHKFKPLIFHAKFRKWPKSSLVVHPVNRLRLLAATGVEGTWPLALERDHDASSAGAE